MRPALTATLGLVILFVGGRHYANAWPGTGGHLLWPLVHVPAWAAAYGWATTMWITSYVAHPGLLAAFPATQLAWMALSPVAAGLVVTGFAGVVRRLGIQACAARSADCRPRTALSLFAYPVRYAKWLSKIAVAGMILFLTGVLCWLMSAGSRPAARRSRRRDRLRRAHGARAGARRRQSRGQDDQADGSSRAVNTSASGGPGRQTRSRRTVLKAGLGGLLGVAAAGAVGVELVNHGVLPGKATLDRIDGACVVPAA